MEINQIRLDDITPLGRLFSSFANPQTGMGTSRSGFRNAIIQEPDRLTYDEENWLYSGNGFVRNMVDLLPIECSNDWIRFKQGKNPTLIDDKLIAYLDDFSDRTYTRIGIRECFYRGSRHGRKHGDGFVLILVADGKESWEPVDFENIQSFQGFFPIKRTHIYPEKYWAGDPIHPNYYRVLLSQSPDSAQPQKLLSNSNTWHHTRVLRFPGTPPDEDSICDNGGFNDSYLQLIINAFMFWYQGVMGGADMLKNYNQGIWKSEELLELIDEDVKSNSTTNQDALKRRMLIADMGMSILKSLLIDKNKEDYTFITRNYNGADKIVQSLERMLAACIDIPLDKAFKLSDSHGLNTSNTAGLAQRFEWTNCKRNFANNYWINNFKYVAKIAILSADSPFKNTWPQNIQFESASEVLLTQKEEAELRKEVADIDKIYIETKVYSPDEARERIAAATFDLNLSLKGKAPKESPKDLEQNEKEDSQDLKLNNSPDSKQNEKEDSPDIKQRKKEESQELPANKIREDIKTMDLSESKSNRSDAVRLSELPRNRNRYHYQGKLYILNQPYNRGDYHEVLTGINGYANLVRFTAEDVNENQPPTDPREPGFWANLVLYQPRFDAADILSDEEWDELAEVSAADFVRVAESLSEVDD